MTSRPERPPQPVPFGITSRRSHPDLPQGRSNATDLRRKISTFIDLTSAVDKPVSGERKPWTPQDTKVLEAEGGSSSGGNLQSSTLQRTRQISEHSGQRGESQIVPTDAGIDAIDANSVSISKDVKLPFPPRPGSILESTAGQRYQKPALRGIPEDKGELPRPYELRPPPFATRFLNDKTADFFPWTGNHPEDALSDQVINGGLYDSKGNNPNETHTARPALWPSLKQKSGLQTLSALFVAVLNKRQEIGCRIGPSTFKPPPRVTLTDTKREAWLRDLANPTVPLRRLSRTIPHGIRGKVLMEQCMSKSVPIPRAMWLAKCVGANEIRAFKRKGVSGALAMNGELKWVREWTILVEQFMESTVEMCGQNDWKAKMDYAIRLSSHLYSEHLLDREHYLRWISTSLEASETDRLPVWMLLAQVYWKDLVANLGRGRRLTESLLSQLQAILLEQDPDVSDVYRPLTLRLQQLMLTLAVSHCGCVIIPSTWNKYRQLLETTQRSSDALRQPIEQLIKRNHRLQCNRSSRQTSSDTSAVLALLNKATPDASTDELAASCLQAGADTQRLVVTVLSWAASCNGRETFRIYSVAKLFRNFYLSRRGTNSAILAYLENSPNGLGFCGERLYRLLAELIRSKHFSVGEYLQHLIATGALGTISQEIVSSDSTNLGGLRAAWLRNVSANIGLLMEMPMHGQSDQVVGLRKTLLQNVGISASKETTTMIKIKRVIQDRLSGIFDLVPSETRCQESELEESLSAQPITIKSEISHWVRQAVATYIAKSSRNLAPGKLNPDNSTVGIFSKGDSYAASTDDRAPAFTIEQYHGLREILEQLDDFPIFADVLLRICDVSNCAVLASIADTINLHADTFTVINASMPIFRKLVERYSVMRATTPPDRTFLISAIDVATKAQAKSPVVEGLKRDLARCDQKSVVAACSPMSDTMADVLQTSKDNFIEEMEQMLASNVTIDRRILRRVFESITSQVVECASDATERMKSLCTLLVRLKSMSIPSFDQLMETWICNILSDADQDLLMQVLPSLVISNALNLSHFQSYAEGLVATLKASHADSSYIQRLTIIVIEGLLALNNQSLSLPVQDAFRFQVQQANFCASHPEEILRHLHEACNRGHQDPQQSQRLKALLHCQPVQSVLRQTISAHGSSSTANSIEELIRSVAFPIEGLVRNLVDPYDTLNLASATPEAQIELVFMAADELSLPLCKFYLQYLLRSSTQPTGTDNTELDNRRSALLNTVYIAIEKSSAVWSELILGVEPVIARTIRENAEQRLASEAERLISSPMEFSGDVLMLRKNLDIIDAVAQSIPQVEPHSVAEAINDKLKLLLMAVERAGDCPPQHVIGRTAPVSALQTICLWIHAFLHLTLLHHRAFKITPESTSPPAPSTTDQQNLINLLYNLAMLLTNPHLQPYTQTTQYLFDTIAFFVDDMSLTSRSQLLRLLGPTASDPRIKFLLSVVDPPDAWLHITTSSSWNADSAFASAQQPPTMVNNKPGQQQHQPPQRATPNAASSSAAQSAAHAPKTVLYVLRRWEMLPQDLPLGGGSSGGGAGHANARVENDTSISLKLFAAKRVQ